MIKNRKDASNLNKETPPKKKKTEREITAEELKYRDAIQEYVKKHIFFDEEIFKSKVPPLFWRRVNGTIEGSRYSKGKSTKSNKKLYTYKEVYETFLYTSDSIDFAMKNNNFEDVNHLINYIFVIINSKIIDIHLINVRKERELSRIKAIEEIRKSEETVDNSDNICYNNDNGYIKKETHNIDEAVLEDLF